MMQEVVPVPHERFCYDVASRTAFISYRVDLEGYRLNGTCTCENFIKKHAPRLENGAAPSSFNRCYHLKQAIQFAWDDMFPLLVQNQHKSATEIVLNLLAQIPLQELITIEQAVSARLAELAGDSP